MQNIESPNTTRIFSYESDSRVVNYNYIDKIKAVIYNKTINLYIKIGKWGNIYEQKN
jgi:hypothetical protein